MGLKANDALDRHSVKVSSTLDINTFCSKSDSKINEQGNCYFLSNLLQLLAVEKQFQVFFQVREMEKLF